MDQDIWQNILDKLEENINPRVSRHGFRIRNWWI